MRGGRCKRDDGRAWEWYKKQPWIWGFNGYPYDLREIETIKKFARLADEEKP